MKFIVTDTDLDIEIAQFDTRADADKLVGTMGQDGALRITRYA